MSDPLHSAAAPDEADRAADPEPIEITPTPEARIAALETELARVRDEWLRAEAEVRNSRARAAKELESARNFAIQKFAGDVVEAAQNLRRGLEAIPAPDPDEPDLLVKLRDGFAGVERSFLSLLERNGIVRRDPAGDPFDAALHQAMGEQPAPAGVPPGTVLQAWTPAWTLNGRLLRPAMVVVAAAPAEPAAAPAVAPQAVDPTG